MINGRQLAIIKKDLQGMALDKHQFIPLLILPFIFMVFIPTLFILPIHFGVADTMELQSLLSLFEIDASDFDNIFVIETILNYLMPAFFLIIPLMASVIMAACSFVGEKENRTLETLLYSPLTLRQIFQAKILASFALSTLVSIASFVLMLVVVEAELMLLARKLYVPGLSWLVNLLLVSPAISLISITLIVRASAKSQTAQQAQQRAVFLILPILLLIVSQLTGIILIDPLMFLVIGIVLGIIAGLMLRGAIGRLGYERVLG